MSREHLYRAKRVDWRELPKEEWWVEGNLLISEDDYYIIPDFGVSCVEKLNNYVCDKPITLHAFEVDKETVCEYTQMTDINKNKIWENDIVLVEHSKMDKESDDTVFIPDIIEYTRNYAVEFVNKGGHCGYRCRNKSIHFSISGNMVYNHKIVVIGNVFDNPELLEGGKAE